MSWTNDMGYRAGQLSSAQARPLSQAEIVSLAQDPSSAAVFFGDSTGWPEQPLGWACNDYEQREFWLGYYAGRMGARERRPDRGERRPLRSRP